MVSSRSQTATSSGDSRGDLPYRSYYSTSELTPEGGTGTSSGPASLSMSVDIHNMVGSPSVSMAAPCPPSPDPEGSSGVALGVSKSDPEEEEESYEGFGYGDGDSPGSSAPSPTRSNPPRDGRSPPCNIGRNTWLRTSLRRTPPSSGNKRLGSNALASQLYRSSSFNSSGRGSTCDTADEIYSDVSLEDDVLGLSHKVQLLQEQMDALADTRSAGEERYARAKQENATLQARVLMLEEAQRDAETRAEERLQAEQRRHREWAARIERERQLQLENYAIRLQAAEVESTNLRDEAARLREQLEKARSDRTVLQEAAEDARRESQEAQEAERKAIARANEAQSLMEAAREELIARTEDQHRLEELVQEVTRLRARNKSLEECRDELQAAAALQAGRELLMLNPCARENINAEASLAAELREGMSRDQVFDYSCICHCLIPDCNRRFKNLINNEIFTPFFVNQKNEERIPRAIRPEAPLISGVFFKRNSNRSRWKSLGKFILAGKKFSSINTRSSYARSAGSNGTSNHSRNSHDFQLYDEKNFHQSTDSIILFKFEPSDFCIDYPIQGVINALLDLYKSFRSPVM